MQIGHPQHIHKASPNSHRLTGVKFAWLFDVVVSYWAWYARMLFTAVMKKPDLIQYHWE